jgi:methylmalonyl-CoA mutase cobalamin-binding subunit
LAIRRIDTLISLMPKPTRLGTLLVGCPSGELHSFPALLLTLMLRRMGWSVTYLGANIPLMEMVQTAAAIQPALIILAAQRLNAAAELRAVAEVFQRSGLALAYGGRIFNTNLQLRGQIPAYFLGETLEESIDRIEQLASAPAPYPDVLRVDDALRECAAVFRFKRPRIEARVIEKLRKLNLANEAILLVNEQFAEGLLAALALGDLAFLEGDLEWVSDLLAERKISAEKLRFYLDAYRKAVDEEMGAASARISDWIGSILAVD